MSINKYVTEKMFHSIFLPTFLTFPYYEARTRHGHRFKVTICVGVVHVLHSFPML